MKSSDDEQSPEIETSGSQILVSAGKSGVIAGSQETSTFSRHRLVALCIYAAIVAALFHRALFDLTVHAATSDLHSHILLVPFISAYLLYIRWAELPKTYQSSPTVAVGPLICGLLAFFAGKIFHSGLSPISNNDYLAVMAASVVCFIVAGGFLFLGGKWMAAAIFPVFFLVFAIPLPDAAVNFLETASKLGSAEAAHLFFYLSRMPFLREGLVFQLPGIALEVAQECSGIRSSWVLFITSLLVANLFLRNPWRRAILVFFVIPLGLLRNGFRILVIGLLCVQIGPEMIHSTIHRRGGPIFFVLSLVPLLTLLWWLRRAEHKRSR
jgi:exosortase C (VPDSG-CTERM-specific)